VSFLRSPTCTDLDRLDADIAVLGALSDEGSPWKPGARFAPRKIRELSVQFAGRGTVDGQRGYLRRGRGPPLPRSRTDQPSADRLQ
jgi:agmatinase